MTVLFHGSFALNREYMAGILDTALKDSDATDKELAHSFFNSQLQYGLVMCPQ